MELTYDNIKSLTKPENQSFTFSLEDTFLEKPHGGGGAGGKMTPPSLFRVKHKKAL